jgi:hypothetical protein
MTDQRVVARYNLLQPFTMPDNVRTDIGTTDGILNDTTWNSKDDWCRTSPFIRDAILFLLTF